MSQNPLIFLDIDGVLNSVLFYHKRSEGMKSDPKAAFGQIDTESIKMLNELIAKTSAKVVVISTWRLNRTIDELQEILDGYGFKGEVIGTTPDMRVGPFSSSILRGNEVLEWMKGHPVELGCQYFDYTRYVILDDDSDFLYWQRNNLLVIDGYVGITPKIVYKAGRMLGSQENFFHSPY